MAEQFKAQAGVTYENPVTGQKVTFSAQDLSNEAAGFLSTQFKPVTAPTAQPTSTGQNIASTPQTTTLPQYVGSSGASKYTLQPNGTYAGSNVQQQPILSGQTAQQATLINPLTGGRVVVESGSQDAQRFFGQGYILDTGQNITDLNKERATQVLQQAQQNSRLAAPVMSDAGIKFPNQLSLDPTAVQRVDMRPIYDLGNPYENPENFTLVNNPNDFQRLAAELGVIDGRTKEGDFFFRASSLDPNDQRIFVRSDVLQQAGVAPDGSSISFNDQSGAAPGQTPTLPELRKFDLGSILNELPQDILSQSFETPKTSFDIQTLLQENRALQAKYLESLIPGQQELELKQQIADVAEQAKNVLQSAELGIEQISDQPIAMQFIVGQAKNVEDRANLKLKALQNQESNLLNRLGIEQENRTITSDVLSNQLQFSNQNIDTLFKIQDRVIAQENQVFERAMALRSESKDVLTSILQNFEGMYFDGLSSDQQMQLAQLASRAGIPIDLLQAGMDNVANQMAQANILEAIKNKQAASADTFKYEMDLRKEFDGLQEVKDYKEINSRYTALVNSWNTYVNSGGSNTSSVEALQVLFQKILDPGSVVREGEFGRSASGQAALDRAAGYLQQLKDGGYGLSQQSLREMVATATEIRNGAKLGYDQTAQRYTGIADAMGLNADRVVSTGNFTNSPSSAATTQYSPLTQSYSSLGSLLSDRPEFIDLVQYYTDQAIQAGQSIDSNEILRLIEESSGFSSDLNMSLKGSENLKNLTNGSTTLSNLGQGTVTGIDGSSAWKWGLDFVLKGAKSALVKAPLTGTIIGIVKSFTNPNDTPLSLKEGKSQNSGFGNQVKIRANDGSEFWISHLSDVFNLSVGDTIMKGIPIGHQGNTGVTMGNTGIHLDLTAKKPDGSYYTAREVAALLGDQRLV